MITKNDIILLLTELQSQGIDTKDDINTVLKSSSIPIDVLKKINDNKSLDIIHFYEKLRKSYNDKRSKLYINIVKSDENLLNDPKTIMTTLSALLNQILQYKATDQTMFYKHARGEEIAKVIEIYFRTYNLEPALQLLALAKADLKVLQMLK